MESVSAGLEIDAGGVDGVAASLSQALYLSYKNYGQFILDQVKDQSLSDPEWANKTRLFQDENSLKILKNWTAALDQDPSDPEFWRRAARFGSSINSRRLERYCLEAAIELDDDPTVMEVLPPSLSEGMAGEQLKDVLKILGDRMALTHPVMAPWVTREMPLLIKKHIDPLPFLPNPTNMLTPPASQEAVQEEPKMIEEVSREGSSEEGSEKEEPETLETWSDLGIQLMKCLEDIKGAFAVCDTILRGSPDEADIPPASEQNAESSLENPDKQKAPATTTDTKTEQKPDKSRHSKGRSVSLPNRKRSQSTAGLPEEPEENQAEKRSKRLRRRETEKLEEAAEQVSSLMKQLQPYQQTDQHLFNLTKHHLESLDIEDKGTYDSLAEILDTCNLEHRLSKLSQLPAQDLKSALTNFNEETASALLSKKEQATLGLSSFLEHAKSGSEELVKTPPFSEAQNLRKFAEKINEGRSWMTTGDIVYAWIRSMSESYDKFQWSDSTKVTVVHILNNADAILYEHIKEKIESSSDSQEQLAELRDVVPMILELHIDIYERITNPSSVVNYATRTTTKYRLARWLDIASGYVRMLDIPQSDSLCARFLWASIMTSSLSDNPVREHILGMWTSLRDFLITEEVQPLRLPNNAVMPLVSPVAAEREISKLTTMDFFLSLFQDEMENPVHVIETLEPVLNPSSVVTEDEKPISDFASQSLHDLWKFLETSSTELRLFLWSRLGDAYEAIQYSTKRFSCHLRSIEMVVADLESERYSKNSEDSRRLLFMRTLKSLDELLIQALSMALNDSNAFDILDADHMRSSSAALAKLNCLLHIVALYEDEVRVGITTMPSGNTFQSLIAKLREMQVRTWCLQYTVFRAHLRQSDSIEPEKDMADYLAAVHHAIGIRKFCKASNKIFLKMMRIDLLKLKNVENWEDYLGQVLYDLHGLKLGVGLYEMEDHGCPHENLEKKQTMQLVEKIMILAQRMPMKDLIKSDLKTTIDHMQQTMGQTKSTPQMIHNLRNFTELLKRPIHPLRLYQALKGSVSAEAVTVNTPESGLAKKGWFFLLGMMALTKFKGVDLNRRQTPGATDDLRIGATFLRSQLQFTADRWDAWFRLGECFDYELDEAVLWSADKMNKERGELVKIQRSAIHCYTLALSHSWGKNSEPGDDTLHDLYHKFGMRLYSSSREPFAMEPFKHEDQERFFIESMGAGTFKKILHDQMTPHKLWKFAARLFRMAMERKPGNWK